MQKSKIKELLPRQSQHIFWEDGDRDPPFRKATGYARVQLPFYQHMLVEDLCAGADLLPDELVVHCGRPSDVASYIRCLAPGWHDASHESALSTLLAQTVRMMATTGVAAYEVSRSEVKSRPFEAHLVFPFRRRRGRPEQLVRRNTDGVWHWRSLGNALVVDIRPKGEDWAHISRIMEGLEVLSDELDPALTMQRLRSVHYDGSFYRRQHALYLSWLTRTIGWNARNLLDEYQTEDYSMRRYITFERVRERLRAAALTGLNQILEIVGQMFQMSLVVELAGAEGWEPLDSIEDDLRTGRCTPLEVVRRLHARRKKPLLDDGE